MGGFGIDRYINQGQQQSLAKNKAKLVYLPLFSAWKGLNPQRELSSSSRATINSGGIYRLRRTGNLAGSFERHGVIFKLSTHARRSFSKKNRSLNKTIRAHWVFLRQDNNHFSKATSIFLETKLRLHHWKQNCMVGNKTRITLALSITFPHVCITNSPA